MSEKNGTLCGLVLAGLAVVAIVWLLSRNAKQNKAAVLVSQQPQGNLVAIRASGQGADEITRQLQAQAQQAQAQAQQAQAQQAQAQGHASLPQTQAQLEALLSSTCEALPEEQQAECREVKQQMLLNGQCAELSQIDPVSGTVCYDLFRYGAYPKLLNFSVNPRPLVPSNFADQYAANEPVPFRNFRQGNVIADGQWTLDLDQIDEKGIYGASEYQSSKVGQNWLERKYFPQTPTAERSALQEYHLVEPLPLM